MDHPRTVESRNTVLVGYSDLDGRPALKLAMHVAGDGRRYLYCGNLWEASWTIVDVTDAESPRVVNVIAGPEHTWTIQVQVADGLLVAGLEKPTPGWGHPPDAPATTGMYVFDLRDDPENPALLSHYDTGGRGTHRNFWAGGDLAVLTATPDGYQHRMLVFVDMSDPTNPVERSRWWWPGQHVAGGEVPEHEVYAHGPAYVHDGRAYVGYGRVGMVVLDVEDVDDPRLVGRVDFGDFGSARPGCHSAVPIPGRGLIVVNSEAHQDKTGEIDALNYTVVVKQDGDDHKIISAFPMPRPEAGLGYRNYFEKGGRFGPHNQHHHQGQPHLAANGNLVYMTYFNAGLRIFDISDEFMPEEVGYFVPDDPPVRHGNKPEKLVTQFEDVLVDDRGFIFCTDKNRGLFVIRHEPS